MCSDAAESGDRRFATGPRGIGQPIAEAIHLALGETPSKDPARKTPLVVTQSRLSSPFEEPACFSGAPDYSSNLASLRIRQTLFGT
jgi:hypothetical protein